MTGHVGNEEAQVLLAHGVVVDKITAEIGRRGRAPAEGVVAETAIVPGQQLELDPATRLFILLQVLQRLAQFPVQLFQVLAVFPVLALQVRMLDDPAHGALQHGHVMDGLGDIVTGATLQRLDSVIQQADTGDDNNRCLR